MKEHPTDTQSIYRNHWHSVRMRYKTEGYVLKFADWNAGWTHLGIYRQDSVKDKPWAMEPREWRGSEWRSEAEALSNQEHIRSSRTHDLVYRSSSQGKAQKLSLLRRAGYIYTWSCIESVEPCVRMFLPKGLICYLLSINTIYLIYYSYLCYVFYIFQLNL